MSLNFINEYRKDGHGFHSFLDQVDNQQYVYTKFEPAFCHYVLPTFDQPDLKASWKLVALAPNDWSVISNEIVSKSNNQGEHDQAKQILADVAKSFNADKMLLEMQNPTVTRFEQSPKISTYLFAIVAGPFKHVEYIEQGLPPMRVYLRSSLMQTVDQTYLREMMTVTKRGMFFYQDLFGKNYVFSKYD